ncbi:MAG: chemotaxis protein CheW [Lachnospira eligens]
METNILIESGTNELEVLEFTIGNNHYGINVAKIQEIVPYSPSYTGSECHPSVKEYSYQRFNDNSCRTLLRLLRVLLQEIFRRICLL